MINSTIKKYYELAKPGIIYANTLTAIAGFFFASGKHVNLVLFLGLTIGASLGLASACIFNNYIDRGIDRKMQRTKNRALAAGTIPVTNALLLAAVTGILGVGILLYFTNLVTLSVGALGFIDYLIFYTIAKRKSVYGTLVGAVSGATPLVAGYTSVANRLDTSALLLFLIMVCWQMAHFYAIAIYRKKDYEEASIPVLPIKQGLRITNIQMLLYIAGFSLATTMLFLLKSIGVTFLTVMLLVEAWWFIFSLKGFALASKDIWAKKMFGISLIVLLTLCLMLSIGKLFP